MMPVIPLLQPLEVQTASLNFEDDDLSLAEDSLGMCDPIALSARIKGVTDGIGALDQNSALQANALFGFNPQQLQGPNSPGNNSGKIFS